MHKAKPAAKKAVRVALRIVARPVLPAAQQMPEVARRMQGAVHLRQIPKKQIQRVSKPGQSARVRNYSRASSVSLGIGGLSVA